MKSSCTNLRRVPVDRLVEFDHTIFVCSGSDVVRRIRTVDQRGVCSPTIRIVMNIGLDL